uniref:Uncharacterized protein n=1 Tax=Cynoglossus semilaevis TaxID=244447 RepID=A0A3P8VA49_CYNSE
MAAEGDVVLDLEAEENCTSKPRVTDYEEEKEISSSELETAMSVIGDRRSQEQKAKQEKEKELAKTITGDPEITRGLGATGTRPSRGTYRAGAIK